MATMGTHQTVFTEPSAREVAAVRVFDAPRELVWAVHTQCEHLRQWQLGPDPGWTMPGCDIDLRRGGEWHFRWESASGEPLEIEGTYKEVSPPVRLVNTERWGGDWPEALDTLTLTEENGQTTLMSTVLYPTKEDRDRAIATGMKEGWSASYDRLEEYLKTIG